MIVIFGTMYSEDKMIIFEIILFNIGISLIVGDCDYNMWHGIEFFIGGKEGVFPSIVIRCVIKSALYSK